MNFAEQFAKSSYGSSSAARLVREQAIIEGLWIPQASGKKAFVLLHIDKPKYQAYKNAIDGISPINLEDFGRILYSGIGLPSKEQRDVFNEQYGLFSEQEFQQ